MQICTYHCNWSFVPKQLRYTQPWYPVVLRKVQLLVPQGVEHMAFLIKKKSNFFSSYIQISTWYLVSDHLAIIQQISNLGVVKETVQGEKNALENPLETCAECPLKAQPPTPYSALSVRPYSKRLNKKGR